MSVLRLGNDLMRVLARLLSCCITHDPKNFKSISIKVQRCCLQASGKKEIPKFYFPQGQPLSPSARSGLETKIEALLKRHSQGISVPAIKELFTEVENHYMPQSLQYYWRMIWALNELSAIR